MSAAVTTIHLIANAHIDPVWLWDWREGLNEGLTTVRSILRLMDEDPELCFIRGESVIYEHVEAYDPASFAAIKRFIAAGRWDVVGGTFVQSDNNLPATETLCRQFDVGLRYFEQKLGVRPTAAWSADCFGHAAGLPEVLANAGMESIAFTRPAEAQLAIGCQAFWWEGASGQQVLAYRPRQPWYGTDRGNAGETLDAVAAGAARDGLRNVAMFFGLGNHGGGPTRRQIADIRKWSRAHKEFRLVFSTLHRFFAALREEVQQLGHDRLPVHRGELNYCLRGCYSSLLGVKQAFRQTQAQVLRAERTAAAIGGALGVPVRDSTDPWRTVLFNAFHDILPGSVVERAAHEQIAALGGARHAALGIEADALLRLTERVDTTVIPPAGDDPSGTALLLWNPHPWAVHRLLEFETLVDYRPDRRYLGRTDQLPLRVCEGGRRLPFQTTRAESTATIEPDLPWRVRWLTPVQIGPVGWTVLEAGLDPAAGVPTAFHGDVGARGDAAIFNRDTEVVALIGDTRVRMVRAGVDLLGEAGLSAAIYDDRWGSWGGITEEEGSLDISTVREVLRIEEARVLERGPLRAALWVRLAGRRTRLELTLRLESGSPTVEIVGRCLFDERKARLKLHVGAASEATFEVPGARVDRGVCGELPGGSWAIAAGGSVDFGFASDSFYNFDLSGGIMKVTVARASHFCDMHSPTPDLQPWRPVMDTGEHRFRACITTDLDRLPEIAAELEQPIVVLPVPPGRGTLPRRGSLLELAPAGVELLGLSFASRDATMTIRLRETKGTGHTVRVRIGNTWHRLGPIAPYEIRTWAVELPPAASRPAAAPRPPRAAGTPRWPGAKPVLVTPSGHGNGNGSR